MTERAHCLEPERTRSPTSQDGCDKGQGRKRLVSEGLRGKKEELADLDSRGIRPILEALEATGQLANTVIFFTSDTTHRRASLDCQG